jgi:hypothetical protein
MARRVYEALKLVLLIAVLIALAWSVSRLNVNL